MRESRFKYPFGLAVYPKDIGGFVVSENKICIQYSFPQVKLRTLGLDPEALPKDINTDRYSKAHTQGTDYAVVSVGCQLSEVLQLQANLIAAYMEHKDRFNNADFLKSLKELHTQMGELL